jgi:hypothetical protein
LDLYRLIWDNKDLPANRRQLAGFEAVLLMLMDNKTAEAQEVLKSLNASGAGPYLLLIEDAMGLPRPEDWEEIAQNWQVRLQRSRVLAEVARQRADWSREEQLQRMDLLLAERIGEDRFEWPLPFAEYVRGRL